MKRAGLSLVETLASVAIVALVLGGGVLILVRITQSEEALARQIRVDRSIASALARLRRDFKAARIIEVERIDPAVLDLTGAGEPAALRVSASPLYEIRLTLPDGVVLWRSLDVWPEDLPAQLSGLRDNPAYEPVVPDGSGGRLALVHGNETVDERIPAPAYPDFGEASPALQSGSLPSVPLRLLQRRVASPRPGVEPAGGWSPNWIASGFSSPPPPSAATSPARFPEDWLAWETVFASGLEQELSFLDIQIHKLDSDGDVKVWPAAAGVESLGFERRGAITEQGELTITATPPRLGDLVSLTSAEAPPLRPWGAVVPGVYRVADVREATPGSYVARLDLEGRRFSRPLASVESTVMTPIPSLLITLEFTRRSRLGEPATETVRLVTAGRRAGDMR